jgi:predicted negative regulator of RcsB-dependent stress response
MPPAKRRRPRRRQDSRILLRRRFAEIQAQIAKLKRARAAVKRDEFVEVTKSLHQVQKNTDDLATQLTRIGQLQADVDAIKRALVKAKLLD